MRSRGKASEIAKNKLLRFRTEGGVKQHLNEKHTALSDSQTDPRFVGSQTGRGVDSNVRSVRNSRQIFATPLAQKKAEFNFIAQQTGLYPYPLGAGSARPNPKRALQTQKLLHA